MPGKQGNIPHYVVFTNSYPNLNFAKINFLFIKKQYLYLIKKRKQKHQITSQKSK